MIWRCRERTFDLAERPLVMGIVNVTPDSFSDGGRFLDPAAAADRVMALAAEGADLVDLGAESTRPGAPPVAEEEQLARLLPVLERLHGRADVALSIDTSRAAVARRALQAGAAVVNDVTALGDPAMAGVVADTGAGVVLMHMQGAPATMQQAPRYDDAAHEVAGWLGGRVEHARAAGIAADRITVDPGIGFGKTPAHNLELLARLGELAGLQAPIVIGVSRKSFLAGPLGLAVDDRLEPGLAAAAVAVFLGAHVVRTHDVRATVKAVRMAAMLRAARRDA